MENYSRQKKTNKQTEKTEWIFKGIQSYSYLKRQILLYSIFVNAFDKIENVKKFIRKRKRNAPVEFAIWISQKDKLTQRLIDTMCVSVNDIYRLVQFDARWYFVVLNFTFWGKRRRNKLLSERKFIVSKATKIKFYLHIFQTDICWAVTYCFSPLISYISIKSHKSKRFIHLTV